MGINDEEIQLEQSGPKFDPPLYIQRYETVRNILRSPEIEKVADFGCSNGSFTKYLKNLTDCKEIALVDVHYGSLKQAEYSARPLAWDYVQKRDNPLQILIYQGSIAEKDRRLHHYDAVTMIEVIEHLHSEELLKIPEVIFDFIKPKMAVVTTPNSEFNCLFPNKKEFRHWDHKFEWTRNEFQNWSKNIIEKYSNYEVTFGGMGEPPEDRKDVGHCTQMAIFKQKNLDTNNDQGSDDDVVEEPYKLFNKFEYPGKKRQT